MAQTPVLQAPPAIRRFELPDIDRHGPWLIPRLTASFPHLTERNVLGWLKSLLYANEFKFLYAENSVGLAQMMQVSPLDPRPMVCERFVLARASEHVAEAAFFYADFAVWARHLGCEVMIVEELSDVPHDAIKEKIGRLFTRQQVFARL